LLKRHEMHRFLDSAILKRLVSEPSMKVGKRRKYEGQDLEGESFAGLNLRDFSFRNTKLARTDFTGADIRSVSFHGLDLSRARFEGARLGRTFWSALGPNLCVGIISALASAFTVLWNAALFNIASEHGVTRIVGFTTILFSAGLTALTFRRGLTRTMAAVVLVFASVVAVAFGFAGAGQSALSTTVALAVARAFGFAFAFSAAISSAGAGKVAGFSALVSAGAIAIGLARMGETGDAGAGAAVFAWQLVVIIYINRRLSRRDKKFAWVAPIGVWVRSLGGTSFRDANLSGASFENTGVAGTIFSGANLLRVRWRGARFMHQALFGNSLSRDQRVECLLVNGHSEGASCDGLDLKGLNLDAANLTRISLSTPTLRVLR
jgi:uncharacterized protein YjbI with pentapeptide repeats